MPRPASLRLRSVPAALALAAASTAALAQPVEPSTAPLTIPSTGEDINPTSRTVTLTVPLRDGGRSLGDVIVEIEPDDSIRLSAARLYALLEGLLGREALTAMRASPQPSLAALDAAGVRLRYNAQELAIDLAIAGEVRASRSIQVSSLDPELVGRALAPAKFSAYLNLRSSLDYLHGDGGAQAPVTFLDGAARLFGIVAEGEGIWQPGESGRQFYRAGSRLVYDDQERLVRWTAGDLQPLGRAFQALPEMAGLSVYRSYGVLQPQRIARPRGDRSFSLARPSTVEVQVNGQVVRRVQLDPGNYDLRDFPFTQGSNDVRLFIVDDSGRSQVLSFNIFLDQAQLGRGLTEFGLYAGVLTGSGLRGIDYSDNLAATGFIRHGVNDRLTLGANLQGDRRTQMGGGEALWSSPIGTFGATASLSHSRARGMGHAVVLTFQRVVTAGELGGDSLNLFVERRSRDFAVLGAFALDNPFAWEAGGGYARPLTRSLYAGVDGRYSRGRGVQPDVYNARLNAGLRVNDRLSVTAEARYEKDSFARRLSGLLTATLRLGRYSNLRGEFDTRFDRARLSYSTFRGQGVGAYNVVADLDRSDAGSGVNVAANYFANRAELGFSHFGTFENTFGSSLAQRSSLRLASSLAFADGALSLGRPIYDSFAIVRGHRSLERASIEVERTPFGYIAETGTLGTAVHPSLPAYIDRTITVDAPAAPATADLGTGAYRVIPPYRGGYLLTVGSAYNVTAIGRLLNREGEPVALASGTVTELGQQGREPRTVFTNREGRFGAVGLAPGRWRIDLNDEANSSFVIDVPRDAKGVLQVGELRPAVPAE